jgi:hypothetical protein
MYGKPDVSKRQLKKPKALQKQHRARTETLMQESCIRTGENPSYKNGTSRLYSWKDVVQKGSSLFEDIGRLRRDKSRVKNPFSRQEGIS